MTAWIEFKGVRSDEMGCKIEAMPAEYVPKRRYTRVTVPGRSGALAIDEGAYEPVTLTASLNLAAKADPRAVNAWLTGSGDLVLSDSPQYRRKAIVIDGIPYKRRRLCNGEAYDTLAVKFLCDPFLYESEPEILPLESGAVLTNLGTAPAEPVIEVTGSGQVALDVGGVGVLLEGLRGTVTLDCEAKAAQVS